MGRITLSDIKLLPYNYSNQDSVALAERWIHWPIEHNVGFRNRHIQYAHLIFHKMENQFYGGRIFFSTNGAVAI